MKWERCQPGAYMTDGEKLYEILRRNVRTVEVYDCATPVGQEYRIVLDNKQVGKMKIVVSAPECQEYFDTQPTSSS